MEKDQDRFRGLRQVSLLTAIPVLLVLGPIIGWWFGSFLDRRWGTGPYLMVLFIVLGFVASGRETWKLIKLASGPDATNKEH
jgi:F0F1-type ATP synthase assembly protein I